MVQFSTQSEVKHLHHNHVQLVFFLHVQKEHTTQNIKQSVYLKDQSRMELKMAE